MERRADELKGRGEMDSDPESLKSKPWTSPMPPAWHELGTSEPGVGPPPSTSPALPYHPTWGWLFSSSFLVLFKQLFLASTSIPGIKECSIMESGLVIAPGKGSPGGQRRQSLGSMNHLRASQPDQER